MPYVVVVGSVNVDLSVRVRALPGPGDTVLGPRVERSGGGKGANAAVAAARAGAQTALVGAVGDDDLGAGALADLREAGVDVSGVATLGGEATGTALIVVADDGENQIAVGAGANAAVSSAHVERELQSRLPGAGCVLVSTEIPDEAVAAAVHAAGAARILCILNPAPARPSLLALAAERPLLTPNAGEARALAGPDGGDEAAARRLAARTGAPVVVTLGEAGALLVAEGAARRFPAPSVRAVDATGAGDAFNGTLAARLAAGDRLEDAVPAAVAAASRSVERVGAR